ncbi:unnamed protein product [Paramecium pentaurelia]|uniref:Uncharacterized protein n=1 Tax=Paramecium pentaurelia TaxID=43138 RepID=A0A8S1SPL4_9CILI|nr:unnamed protein product [Paramecium pentaurelia]
MNFLDFIQQQIQENQDKPEEVPLQINEEEPINLNENLDISANGSSSDEEQLYEEYFKEKPSIKATYDEIYEKLKQNSPPQTELENEQLQIIAELQAKLVVQETELLILKKLHFDLKNKQSHQTNKIEQLQKEKDVMTQMKIGYDKKFQKLDEKRKIIDQNQRIIKKLAMSTSNDYLESAIKRVNQQVKINDKVQILQQQPIKENPQVRKLSNQKQQNSFRNNKK